MAPISVALICSFLWCAVPGIEATERKQKPVQSTTYSLKLDGINCLTIKPRTMLRWLTIQAVQHDSETDSASLRVTASIKEDTHKDDSKEMAGVLRLPLITNGEIKITGTLDPHDTNRILLSISGHK